MGLFVQKITLGISNGDFLVEKVQLPKLTKSKIDVTVLPGTIAVIGGGVYKGNTVPYKLTIDLLGAKKASTEAFLVPDKMFDSIAVNFFGGQHIVSISSLPAAKAKFSIVGTAMIEIADYKELAKYFNRTITKEDLINEINENFRVLLSNEVISAASKYITADTTEVTLQSALNSVAQDVIKSRKTASALFNIGLMMSAKGITMHLNAIEGADEVLRKINDALTDKAVKDLNNDVLDRQEKALEAERRFEIDKIRAERTDINESTQTKNINTNTNGNGKVIINNGKSSSGDGSNSKPASKQFCPECGVEIRKANAKYCPSCGSKL